MAAPGAWSITLTSQLRWARLYAMLQPAMPAPIMSAERIGWFSTARSILCLP